MATAAASLALLLSLTFIPDAPPTAGLLVAFVGGLGAWLWVGVVWRRRSR